MKISYNWLKAYVPDIPEPHRLADIFTYHICEVESYEKLPDGDYLFDLGVLPNRAHDLLSHQGIAHELASLLRISYKDPSGIYKTPASKPTTLTVDIQTDKVRRYSARIIRNITIGPSSEWVKKHLESIGQRSINNVVDATNLIMYDCGQPTHAFDLDKLTSAHLIIESAQKAEKITLLDGKEVELDESVVTIRDKSKVLALAGVKGGKAAEVTTDTKNILIEVANFDPISVRKTARRLGILTDSAKRFENDLSPELCTKAMFELSALFVELFPDASFEDIVDIYPVPEEGRVLIFTIDDISKKLGVTVERDDLEKILSYYNLIFMEVGGMYTISVPPLRLDLVDSEDVIEEIGRVMGYDKVNPVLPKIDFVPKENKTYLQIMQTRMKLVADGYRETMTYAFADRGDIEVLASASDKKFLRTNLSDGLKKAYEMNKLNIPLLGGSEVKIFEIGTVFKKEGESVNVAYADKKGITEMSLDAFSEKNPFSGESWKQNLSSEKVFTPWSVYPFIARDIAVWVPEGIMPETLAAIYKEFGAEILRGEPTLFDQFTKDGRTSYAFRLVFQAYDRTLTDDEVGVIVGHITEKLASLEYTVR
jgi:phenylalanyl-tRNA synthetase beta subunit